NFIDLFPDENIANGLAEQRLNQLFLYLYEKQSDDKKKKITPDANNDVLEKIKNTLIEKLAQVGQKAEAYYADLKLECPDIQNKLVKDLIESFENVRPLNFFEFIFYVFECDKKEIEISGQNIIDYFIHVVDTYLFKEAKETVLFKLLKEMAECLDKKKVFENEKIITGFRKILERFIFKADTDDLNNPNIWVLSMYIGLWLCQYQKLPSLSFFKKGFSILRKTATNGSIEQRVAMDLHPYWLSILQLIGPFMCAENMVKICRKTTLQKNEWEIPKNIHFHLEVFFDNRLKHLALFLTVVNNLRTTNDTEAYYKFLLLENFLKEYQNSHLEFSDLFIENSYKTLSGKFRKEISDYKDSLSDIHYPIKSRYFQKILHTIFQEMLKGRSLLFTDIATFILSLPTFEMSEEALNIFKKTSLGELVLLSMIYDIPEDEKKKQQDLKRFMMFMIEKQLIDVSYFLNLLLFRVDEIKMEELEQESDNGISRYFNGLVSYISCALPYLEDDDLKSIKKIIQNCLSGLKIRMIREFLVKNVVGYLASQLSEDDFSTIYEDIFSLAERDALDSPLFEFLTISPKDAKHLKYGRFRLILDKNLDKLGTSADRDFVLFLLNHKREDIIPSDETIEKQLEIYFKNKFADTSHLSLQWLMDLQNFIEKGYIALDGNTEKRVKEFFEQASKDNAFYFEWKLFAEKMIPVYKRFSHLMEPGLVGKIMEGFLKNAIGNEMKLNELTETQVNGFAHQLKEIYECLYHQELKDKAMGYAKDMINKGLPGGGYLSAFWDGLVEDEKKHLGELMISLWRPPDEKTVIKAIQATSKFLKYPTDKATEAELTNLVTYTALYNSPRLKIETIKLFSLHAGQNTDWFQEYRERVLNLLPYLHIEKDLNLLRQLILFLRPLTDDRAKESINYLRHEAPYAEIRRAAQ
ncbi:MAG: hypothetical protein MUF15_09275, partial [Acidobacteria bacterium]|nr:hypothetical protein [Acidobacteriota bacterium]